jgi:hypothetical protein
VEPAGPSLQRPLLNLPLLSRIRQHQKGFQFNTLSIVTILMLVAMEEVQFLHSLLLKQVASI